MASAYSILRNYGDYIQPYDFNLIQQGLEYKQAKFDANSTRLQAEIDQFANLDLAKQEDKEYLNKRLGTLVEQVNQFGTMDLSSNGITRNLSNHVKQVLDENVMAAYKGTQNLKNYQQEVAYYKKNKPKQYSTVNEMYGMRSAIEWLNDGQVGTEYKGSTYTPYTDVQGKLNTAMTQLVKTRPENIIEFPTNDGRMIKKKVKELNAEEIRSVATNMLSTQDRQQLSINGWYNFGRVSPEYSKQILGEYKNERTTVLDGQIAALELQSKQGVNSTLKQEMVDQIQFLKRQKNQFEARIASVPQDSANIGTFLEQEKLVNGLASTHAFREIQITSDNDQAYWNKVDHNYKIHKDNRDYELALRKQNFEESKTKQVNSVDSDGDGVPDFKVVSGLTDTEGKEIDVEGELYKSIDTNASLRKSTVDKFYGKLEGSNKDKFDKALEVFKLENPTKSDDEAKLEVSLKLANNGQNTSFMDVGTFNTLSTIDSQIKGSKQALMDATGEVNKVVEAKVEKLYDVALSNSNISTFQLADGRAVKTSLKKYLKERGINSFEDLKANKKEFTKFMSQANADMLLSEMGFGTSMGVQRGGAGFSDDKLKEKTPKFQFYLSQVASQMGEQASFGDIFDVKEEFVKDSGDTPNIFHDNYWDFARLKGSSSTAPKTLAFLKNVMSSGAYDKGYNFFDDSFQDDNTSQNILDYTSSANKQVYNDKLKEAYGKLPQNKIISIQPKSTLFKEATGIAEAAQTGFKVEDGTTLRVYQNPVSPSEVYIEQIQVAGKGAKTGIVNEIKRVSVPKKDLSGSLLEQAVNLENKKSNIHASRMKPIVKTNINFASDANMDYVQGLERYVFGKNSPNLGLVTKQGVINNLYSEYGAFYKDNKGESTDIGKVVNSFIANTAPFSLKVRPNNEKSSIMVEVNYKDKQGEIQNLDMLDLQTASFDAYQSLYDSAPQVFLYTALKKILDESIQGSIMSGGEVTNEKLQTLKSIYEIQ